MSSFRICRAILAIGVVFVAGCPGGSSSPTGPPPTATPPPPTSTPVATAVPTSTPTRTPTPAVTGAVCANLSGEWESDWTICTRTQENPGPGVFFAQTGCSFTAAILGLGTMSGTISGTGDATRISWSFAMTPPCTGTATGVATIDTSMGQTIYFRFDNPVGWSCAGGCPSPPLIAFRRDLPTPTPAMRPRR